MQFLASPISCLDQMALLANGNPLNPFCTQAYLQYMKSIGAAVWIGGLYEGSTPIGLSGLFLWRGRLNSTLVIHSLPACAALPEYWSGLIQFGRRHGITQIDANSFGSPPFTLPPLVHIRNSWDRVEHVIVLADYSEDNVHLNHRRNIRRAERAGLVIARSSNETACREHIRLIGLSQIRQQKRGDKMEAGSNIEECLAFCREGCAEIFQARDNCQPLSSVMTLRSPKGAYYHTAGTDPKGMKLGASHFLVHHTAILLQQEGVFHFNLGGALPGTTLATFKQRFGTRGIALTAAKLYIGSCIRERISQVSQTFSNWKFR